MYAQVKDSVRLASDYDYEIIFGDNCSVDSSQQILRELAKNDKKVKVIFNNRNFGPDRSFYNLLFSATGDAVIGIVCDLQEPPEMIPKFIKEWESGNLIVWGQKIKSKEEKIKRVCRVLYYKIISQFSDVPQYEQVTGFGLIDRSVIEVIKECNEPYMALRNLIPELGYSIKLIPYTQLKRKNGKTSYNLWRYFDFAVRSLVRTSSMPLHVTTIMGFVCAVLSFIIGIIYLIYKLIFWNAFSVGMAPMLIAIFFLGSVQLLSLGFIGEYIGIILTKVTKRPLVTERERINFDENVEIESNKE